MARTLLKRIRPAPRGPRRRQRSTRRRRRPRRGRGRIASRDTARRDERAPRALPGRQVRCRTRSTQREAHRQAADPEADGRQPRPPCPEHAYPHPIIAREGWPFCAIAVAVGAALSHCALVAARRCWRGSPSSSSCSSSAIRRARFRSRPNAVLSPADGRDRQRRHGARPVSRPRRAEDQRLHERVQRALEPQPGRRRRSANAGITPGSFVNAALDKASLENERNALHLRPPPASTSPACRSPGSIARRILCYVEAGRPSRARPALRLHPLRLARRRLPAADATPRSRSATSSSRRQRSSPTAESMRLAHAARDGLS